MTPEQGRALDHQLTTPPSTCDEDGHDWHRLGTDAEGTTYYICRRCRHEDDQ